MIVICDWPCAWVYIHIYVHTYMFIMSSSTWVLSPSLWSCLTTHHAFILFEKVFGIFCFSLASPFPHNYLYICIYMYIFLFFQRMFIYIHTHIIHTFPSPFSRDFHPLPLCLFFYFIHCTVVFFICLSFFLFFFFIFTLVFLLSQCDNFIF